MDNVAAIDISFGALALALAILCAAWHEYKSSNPRDAKLLTVIGSLSLVGSAVALIP